MPKQTEKRPQSPFAAAAKGILNPGANVLPEGTKLGTFEHGGPGGVVKSLKNPLLERLSQRVASAFDEMNTVRGRWNALKDNETLLDKVIETYLKKIPDWALKMRTASPGELALRYRMEGLNNNQARRAADNLRKMMDDLDNAQGEVRGVRMQLADTTDQLQAAHKKAQAEQAMLDDLLARFKE